ncbi:hypothetical protein I317_02095 [Kwoniella heveanensis CBS 569]|uniref:Metallo-beta-lactamase domain-containing protein n=1 Tax=Kwoniella heveanensis BCC8398 TaxID=1296120 RepID=A0A1B9GNZ1_9TREE|nr:hypothetical protein I316_05652 [Kwoniella heveanensis BCC8398]OCF43989.1 hypothetical protein I317_02095 [Kwoniella heveanensis CBS 569]
MVIGNIERLSDATKLSAHVTRILGQNPGLMTLQGTNSYLLQPPSNPHAPLILIDTSSPHTANQYVDLLLVHLHHLGLESGTRETHFESNVAKASLSNLPEDQVDQVKASLVAERAENGRADELMLVEYGPGSKWTATYHVTANGSTNSSERKLPNIEHIILTHRHLDHVGALPTLLRALKSHGCPPPKLWKFPSPDEAELCASERDRPTSDAEIWQSLPAGTYQSFSPLQPFHPIIPGLMISIIDPVYRHLLKHDKDGKPKWNEVPEIARVSVRCLRTPGHTQDSVSLVMLEGEKGVFTGDTVLGQGTTTFLDLASYMTSLRTLLALKPNVLYPAHGPHIPNAKESRAHLEEYITHRQIREDQIVNILQKLSARTTSDGNPNNLTSILIDLKRAIHAQAEADNAAKAPLMVDRRKAIPMPDFEDEKASLERAEKEGTRPQAAVPMSVLCRLLYKSEDERLIFAASKSVGAHLVKLEKEDKARRGRARWADLAGKEVGELVEVETWEYVGPPEQAEAEAKETKEKKD